MATIDKITLPDGSSFDVKDNISGYTENGILKGGINTDNNHAPSNLWINWQGDRLDEDHLPIYNLGIDLTNYGQSLYQPRINVNRSIDNGQNWTNVGVIGGGGNGTVTSVRVQATSPVQSSVSTAQSTSLNTTISLANGYGDTKNPYGSKSASTVLAAPSDSNGVPTFRHLTTEDIGDFENWGIVEFENSTYDEVLSAYEKYGGRLLCYFSSFAETYDRHLYAVLTGAYLNDHIFVFTAICDNSDTGYGYSGVTYEVSLDNGWITRFQSLQELLISGTNIKTVNGNSLLGSGNIAISSGLQNLVDGTATGSIRQIYAIDDTTNPLGQNAAAFGYNTKAIGPRSHAEGYSTIASGNNSHVEGTSTNATGTNSHAEGAGTEASGVNSHASGWYTTAQRKSQTTLGEYNILDTGGTDGTTRGNYAFIIGNGKSSSRSNAFTVAWDGVATASGKMVCADMSSTEIEDFCDGLFNGTGLLSSETITLWDGILGNE